MVVVGHTQLRRTARWNFYMVMEKADGKELMDRIVKHSHFSERVAASFFRQMVQGVKWCHDHKVRESARAVVRATSAAAAAVLQHVPPAVRRDNRARGGAQVCHRDLKPENFLLASMDADAALKVTDFGLSCFCETPGQIIRDACGSAYYIAPEVFSREYTMVCDVWSLGIMLYLLLSGTVPFGYDAAEETQVYDAIVRDPLRMEGEVRGGACVCVCVRERE